MQQMQTMRFGEQDGVPADILVTRGHHFAILLLAAKLKEGVAYYRREASVRSIPSGLLMCL